MFATEEKKLKSYPEEILGTHLPVTLDPENIQVKMYNHMKQITAYFQNFPEDTYLISSLYYIGKKRNLKKKGLLLHTSDN